MGRGAGYKHRAGSLWIFPILLLLKGGETCQWLLVPGVGGCCSGSPHTGLRSPFPEGWKQTGTELPSSLQVNCVRTHYQACLLSPEASEASLSFLEAVPSDSSCVVVSTGSHPLRWDCMAREVCSHGLLVSGFMGTSGCSGYLRVDQLESCGAEQGVVLVH